MSDARGARVSVSRLRLRLPGVHVFVTGTIVYDCSVFIYGVCGRVCGVSGACDEREVILLRSTRETCPPLLSVFCPCLLHVSPSLIFPFSGGCCN